MAPPRAIADVDLIDRLGLSAWVDMITVTILALICGAVIYGVLIAFLRKGFGSAKEMKVDFDAAEALYFDLVARKAQALTRIKLLIQQIEAVQRDLDRRFAGRAHD